MIVMVQMFPGGLPQRPSGQDTALLMQEAWIHSLVGELGSHMLCSIAQRLKNCFLAIKSSYSFLSFKKKSITEDPGYSNTLNIMAPRFRNYKTKSGHSESLSKDPAYTMTL